MLTITSPALTAASPGREDRPKNPPVCPSSDALTVLRASPWLAPMPKDLGVRVIRCAVISTAGLQKRAALN